MNEEMNASLNELRGAEEDMCSVEPDIYDISAHHRFIAISVDV
jgi:hypothetical protein